MPHQSGVVVAEQSRSIAEVQAAVLMAKQFPRDHAQAINRIRMACQRPALAEVSTYTYNRGGADVSGPSVRLAEAIAQCWGNIQFGVRELSQANGESTVEAYAWDLETNTRQVKVFQVPHIRYTKSGSKRLTDPRDIYETVANNGARRLRACILGILPGDVVEEAVNECENTLKVTVELSPEKISKLVKAFEGFGVTKDMLQDRIQRPVDTITPALYVSLTRIGNSLKDGMSKTSDWFKTAEVAPVQTTPQTVSLSKPQMRDAAQEIREKKATLDDILARFPTLDAKQREELTKVAAE